MSQREELTLPLPSDHASTSRYPQHLPPRSLSPPPHNQSRPLPSYLSRLPLSPRTLTLIQANTGLLLVASSQIFFVGMGLTAKFFVSTTSLSTLTLIFVRMLITALLCLLWLHFTGDPNPILGPPDPTIRRLLVLRGFFGFGGLFANYQSLRGLSVSDSVTIQFLAPNLTALLGWAVLGEIMGWREVTAGVACLGGVVLVSRPPFIFGEAISVGGTGIEVGSGSRGTGVVGGVDMGISARERFIAVGWAFTAVTFATCAYVTIRKIGKQAHAMHSMLYFCYSCLITTTIGLLFQIRTFVFLQSWKEFWLIMLIGAFGFIGQILLTFGLQREKAGRASLAMYLSLFYSIVFELVFFGTVPPLLSLLGATIIIVSAVWVALSKKTEDPSSSGTYRRVETEDEESLLSSRSDSPIPLTGRSGTTSSIFPSDPVIGNGKKEEIRQIYPERRGSGQGLGHISEEESQTRSLLRRKSSTGSGKDLRGIII